MNLVLAVAAGLVFLIGPLHSVLGERLIFRELFQQELPPLLGSPAMTRRVLRMFWHLVSLFWWGLAAMLGRFALLPVLDPSARWTAHVIALAFFVSGTASLIVTRGRHLSWWIFLAVAGVIWIGLLGQLG